MSEWFVCILVNIQWNRRTAYKWISTTHNLPQHTETIRGPRMVTKSLEHKILLGLSKWICCN